MEGMGGLREKGGRDRGEEERNDGRVSRGKWIWVVPTLDVGG